jgi:hypothetical protein
MLLGNMMPAKGGKYATTSQRGNCRKFLDTTFVLGKGLPIAISSLKV